MGNDTVAAMFAAEQEAFVSLIRGLTPEQWELPLQKSYNSSAGRRLIAVSVVTVMGLRKHGIQHAPHSPQQRQRD